MPAGGIREVTGKTLGSAVAQPRIGRLCLHASSAVAGCVAPGLQPRRRPGVTARGYPSPLPARAGRLPRPQPASATRRPSDPPHCPKPHCRRTGARTPWRSAAGAWPLRSATAGPAPLRVVRTRAAASTAPPARRAALRVAVPPSSNRPRSGPRRGPGPSQPGGTNCALAAGGEDRRDTRRQQAPRGARQLQPGRRKNPGLASSAEL